MRTVYAMTIWSPNHSTDRKLRTLSANHLTNFWRNSHCHPIIVGCILFFVAGYIFTIFICIPRFFLCISIMCISTIDGYLFISFGSLGFYLFSQDGPSEVATESSLLPEASWRSMLTGLGLRILGKPITHH